MSNGTIPAGTAGSPSQRPHGGDAALARAKADLELQKAESDLEKSKHDVEKSRLEAEKLEADLEKSRLEAKALEVALRNAQRPPVWPRMWPLLLRVLPSVVLATATIWLAHKSDFFNVREKELAIQRLELERGNRELAERGEKLTQQVDQRTAALAAVTRSLEAVQAEVKAYEEIRRLFPRVHIAHFPEADQGGLGSKLSLDGAWFPRSDARTAGYLANITKVLEAAAKLRGVTEVSVERVPLRANDLRALGRLEGARALTLVGNGLTDAAFQSFPALGRLSRLDVRTQRLVAPAFPDLPELAYLNLRHTDLSDEGLNGIAPRIRGVAEFDLCGTRVSDASVDALRQLPRLYVVDVRGTGFSAAGVKALAALPGMQKVRAGDGAFSASEAAAIRKEPGHKIELTEQKVVDAEKAAARADSDED